MNLRSLTSAPRSGTQLDQDVMLDDATADRLLELGISRRRFLSYCAGLASLMALPQSMVPGLAAAATARTRPSVVYLSFQECTGCLESMVNSFPFQGGGTIENLILNLVSLDFQQTLMAASGDQAEQRGFDAGDDDLRHPGEQSDAGGESARVHLLDEDREHVAAENADDDHQRIEQ